MAGLRLGSHFFDEVLEVSLSNIKTGAIIGIVDQITTASVEISSDSTDITDKNGTPVYTRYSAKTGTANMTNAFFHPVIANAQSGSEIKYAGTTQYPTLKMPKMIELAPGEEYDASDADDLGTIKIIGIYGNGANDPAVLTAITEGTPVVHTSYLVSGTNITMPANGTTDADKLSKYVVIYDRDKDSGMVLTNSANSFPKAVNLKMLVSYVDLCTKETKPAIIEFPSFTPDPNMTLNFDRENANIDFNGTLSTDFCAADKTLYTIYYPDEDVKIVSGGIE